MTDPFTAAELAAAFEGREGAGLAILRAAVDMLTAALEQRALGAVRAAIEAGIDTAGLSAALRLNGSDASAEKPAPAPRTRPTAPEDDIALLNLLLVELGKGPPLTAKALARRTGATTDRVSALLRNNQGAGLRVDGLKWSRKAAP